jgi:hypothetical protein
VASGENIGAVSAETFGQRRHVERTRRAVGRYGDSMIGRGHMREVAKPQMDNPLRQSEVGAEAPPARQRFNAGNGVPNRGVVNIPKRTFSEPSARRYNPYA